MNLRRSQIALLGLIVGTCCWAAEEAVTAAVDTDNDDGTTTTTTTRNRSVESSSPAIFEGSIDDDDDDVDDESAEIIRHYLDKVCKNSASCNLTSLVPASYRDLRVRRCMCDDSCPEYGDCCDDADVNRVSPGSSTSTATTTTSKDRKFECVKRGATANDSVYMISECDDITSSVKQLCEMREEAYLALDIFVMTPVTVVVADAAAAGRTHVTYRNVFCALCHKREHFHFWNLHLSYQPMEPEPPVANSTTPRSPAQIPLRKLLANVSNYDDEFFQFSAVISNKGASSSRNSTTAAADQLEISYKLSIKYTLPEALIDKVRYCARTPRVKNSSTGLCGGHVPPTSPPAKKERGYDIDMKQAVGIPIVPGRCDDVPSSLDVYKELCKRDGSATRSKASSSSSSSSRRRRKKGDVCYKTRIDTGEPCLINDIVPTKEVTVFNETVCVTALSTCYDPSEYNGNGSHYYICGTYVESPFVDRFIAVLDDILSAVLIKISILCLILQLAMFQQLPELKNLSGKNLAAFCTTLLVAFVCLDIGPWLPSCKVTAIIMHYSFLSCFTWMLVMSYDCWLSLYHATTQFRAPAGKNVTKFVTYCLICWIVPLLIVSTSVAYDLSDTLTRKLGCFAKPGYGISKECFIFGKNAELIFFFLPATLMFLGNIGFFLHTAHMIYTSQKNTVNPTTRHDFRLYTRLALLMGLTWTLGALVTITGSSVVALLFSVLNMSQGMFIFFGFTCKKKTLRSLMEKHKDNRLGSTLSSLVSNDPATASTDLKTGTGSTKRRQSSVTSVNR